MTGVTKEVEEAISALQDATADEAYLESSDLAQSSAKIRAAYAGLLAAIEKHASERYTEGVKVGWNQAVERWPG